MADGGLKLDSAGGGLNRARDGAKEVEGEVARLGARGIEARRRGVAGPADGAAMALLELNSAAAPHERGKGNEEAKSDLAIVTTVESLSGAGLAGTATRGIAGSARRRRGKNRGGTVPSLSAF